ncbi:hypothetical protein GCM10027184_45830 [Saccharothrix stipae]
MRRQVGEPDAAVQVDEVEPHLAQPQPRHPVRQERTRLRVHDLRLPRGGRQLAGGRGEALARRVEVGAQQLRQPARALGDVGVAVGRARVHLVLDAGLGPREQVHQGVGVAGEVRHHVASAPAGQQARTAQRHQVQLGDDLVQRPRRPFDLGEPGDRVLDRGRLLARRGYARLGGSDLGGISEAHGHLIPAYAAERPITPA